MKFSLKKILYSTKGKYVVSILLGFGLAALFRKVYNSKNLLILNPPSSEKIISS
jgi:hypothetical protein